MHVRIYRQKRSPYWYVDYVYKGKRRRYSLGIREEYHARLRANEIEKELALGIDPVREAAKQAPLSFFFEKYLAHCKNANTRAMYRDKVNKVRAFLRYFSDVPLETLTTEQLEEYRNDRRQTVKPGTVNREFAVLRHALNIAVQWSYLEKSPADGIKNYRNPPGRVRFLTGPEYDQLISACDKDVRDVIITAVNTGLRRGELFELEVVDIDRNLLTVRRGKDQKGRVLPLNDEARGAIIRAVGDRAEGLIFNPVNFRKRFEGAVKSAGLKDFTFHDLRHTFASWLVMGGVDLATVNKLMGHKTIQMTMRYAHLTPDYMADAVAKIRHKIKPSESNNDVTD